jgi:hypothetical protein
MFVVILFLLGLAFGFAMRLPWALLAFIVPLALAFTASNRNAGAILLGFVVTAIGVIVGLALSERAAQRERAA